MKEKRAWYFQQLTPQAKWERHLRVRYGITVADYERMQVAQRDLCAICDLPSRRKRLSVDHCHQTGAVRGLLCERCNSVLGRVDDSREILLRAAEYLRLKVQLRIAK